jgi:predicted RNase H-like HicB family nuclease
MASTSLPRTARVKIVVQRDEDGYVAYPVGMQGVIVGQGDSFEEALADVTSAIQAHVEQFGGETLTAEAPTQEVFVAEAEVTL